MNQIGRYTLKELLGQGGAGEVYRGVLSGPGGFRRDVAVKMLIENVLSLEREARLGGLLRHQHLVDVYEIGESSGRWFCAMELCKGGALTQHLPLPPRAVIEVGLQICDALQYAHEELGLVHRDLKPSNLLLSDGLAGFVKLPSSATVADVGMKS